MPSTYEPIATTTLGTAASTITFSSIPATYTDLKLILVGTVSSGSTPDITLNNDTSALYSRTILVGDGTSAFSARSTGATSFNANNWLVQLSTTIPTMIEMDFFSYAGSTNKTGFIKANLDYNGSGGFQSQVCLYRSTTAISRIDISGGGSNWKVGTTATLYGIKNA
jgi:hypothetical protein